MLHSLSHTTADPPTKLCRYNNSSPKLPNRRSIDVNFWRLKIIQTQSCSLTEHCSKFNLVLNKKAEEAFVVFFIRRRRLRVSLTVQYQLNVLFILKVIMMQAGVEGT